MGTASKHTKNKTTETFHIHLLPSVYFVHPFTVILNYLLKVSLPVPVYRRCHIQRGYKSAAILIGNFGISSGCAQHCFINELQQVT